MERNLYTKPPLKEYFDVKAVATVAVMELIILGLTTIAGPILGFLIYGSLDAAVSVFVLGILLFFSTLAGFVPFVGPFLYWFAAKSWIVPYVGLPPSLLIDLMVVLNLILSIMICVKATVKAVVFLGVQLGGWFVQKHLKRGDTAW